MNSTTLKGDWNVTKGKLKQKWAQLTDDDLIFAEGKAEELIGRIQRRTGETRHSGATGHMGERRRRDDRCGGQTGGYEESCAVAARSPALYARVPDSEVRFPASLSRTPLRSGCQRPGSRAGDP